METGTHLTIIRENGSCCIFIQRTVHLAAQQKHAVSETIFFEFEKLNAQILGVSLDNVESHQAFSEKYSLPFPLLADLNKECATEYGVLGKFMMMTIAKRQSFVINPEGTIVKHYKKVDPETHTEQVISDLKKLTG
jgi:peroxiredoxin Q/BCP